MSLTILPGMFILIKDEHNLFRIGKDMLMMIPKKLRRLRKCWWMLPVVSMIVMGAGSTFAGEQKDMGGWELDSAYNRYYSTSEMDRLKGVVKKITTVVPIKGMAPGVALLLEESKGDSTLVHICPEWYLSRKQIGLKKGDLLKIKGAWAEINDEFVFMASKIKKGDYFVLKVRLTKSGKPFWTMGPEELAKETAATE